MGLIKRKTNNGTDKDSIIVSLTNAINDLKGYLSDLERGDIYNIERFEKGSTNYLNLEKIIKKEISNVKLSISSLESTLTIIKEDIVKDVQLNSKSNENINQM